LLNIDYIYAQQRVVVNRICDSFWKRNKTDFLNNY
jgi:hypothetical protein